MKKNKEEPLNMHDFIEVQEVAVQGRGLPYFPDIAKRARMRMEEHSAEIDKRTVDYENISSDEYMVVFTDVLVERYAEELEKSNKS